MLGRFRSRRLARGYNDVADQYEDDNDNVVMTASNDRTNRPSSLLEAVHVQVNVVPPSAIVRGDPPRWKRRTRHLERSIDDDDEDDDDHDDDDDDNDDDDDDYDQLQSTKWTIDSPTASSSVSTGALAERGGIHTCGPEALCFRALAGHDRIRALPPSQDDEESTTSSRSGSFLHVRTLALAHAHAYVPTPPIRRTQRDAEEPIRSGIAGDTLRQAFLEIASSRLHNADPLDPREKAQEAHHDSHHETFDIEMVIPHTYALVRSRNKEWTNTREEDEEKQEEEFAKEHEANNTKIQHSTNFITPIRALSPLRSQRVISSPSQDFKNKESSQEKENQSKLVEPLETPKNMVDVYPSKQAWSRIRRAITPQRSPSPKKELSMKGHVRASDNKDQLKQDLSKKYQRSPSPKRYLSSKRDSSAKRDSSHNVTPSSNPVVTTSINMYQSKRALSRIDREITTQESPSPKRDSSPNVIVDSTNVNQSKQNSSRIQRAITNQPSPSPKRQSYNNFVVVSPPTLDPIASSSPTRTNIYQSRKDSSRMKREITTQRLPSPKRQSYNNVVVVSPPSLEERAAAATTTTTNMYQSKKDLSRIQRAITTQQSPSPMRHSSNNLDVVSPPSLDPIATQTTTTNIYQLKKDPSRTKREIMTQRSHSPKRDSSDNGVIVGPSNPTLDPIATSTDRDPPKQYERRIQKEIIPPSRMRYSSPVSRLIPTAKHGNGTHVFMDRLFKNRRKDIAHEVHETTHDNMSTKSEQQQQEDPMAKDDPIPKNSSVPDPPASPSWKIGGTLSPKWQQPWRKQLRRGVNERNQFSDSSNDIRQERWKSQSKEHSRQQHHQEVQQQQQVKPKQPVQENQQVKHRSHDELEFQQQQHPMARRQEILLQDEQLMPQHQETPRQRRDSHQHNHLQKSKSPQIHQDESRIKSQPSHPRKKQQYLQPEIPPGQKIKHQPQQHNLQGQNPPQQSLQKSKQPRAHPTPPKPQDNQPEQKKQPKQPKESSAQCNPKVEELKATVPFKKVLSSPSVMISTFTSQTMHTTNTTTTSKFWDGIEDYQPAIARTPTSPNASFETGLHGNPKKIGNIADEDLAILKKLNAKNKELQEFFKDRRSEDNVQPSMQYWSTPPKSGTPAVKGLTSPGESDSVSNAFSLILPMNKHGYFDDSDISALAMGDSATVYHIRASAAAKNNNHATDYWKEKYERLKEETRRANQLRGIMNEVLVEEDEDKGPLASTLEGVQQPSNKTKDGGNTIKNTRVTVEDDESQLIHQQELLRRCGYGGGKKAKDLARKAAYEKGQPSSMRNLEFTSFLNRAQCLRPISYSDASVESATRDEKGRNRISGNDIAHQIQCPTLVPGDDLLLSVTNGERNIQNQNTRKRSADVPEVQVMTETFSQAEDGMDIFGPAEVSFGFESFNSDLIPLRQIGYVQRMETPSPHLKAPKTNPVDAIDDLSFAGDVLYVMDDRQALKQWNKNRSSRALADELSAAGSHGRASKVSSTDGSELSESAKLIFEAALKHDIKALREQRSRSSSRNPDSRARGDTVVSSPKVSSSVISSHFASNIPQDFATWFELPSPGTSCIPLIPILKGHLNNAAIIELLAGFATDSNTIDANGVHRIAPRHRVNDVLQKSLNEFMDSPLISCNSSKDNEYMGPIIADGDDGSIRFANPSVHLGRISDAATTHIKKREFQDAIDIYITLLRSCQASSESTRGLVGQLLASTLHNLCVVHLWKEEFEVAMPYCRECLRMITESSNDNLLMAHSWANMGLIHYSMEAHSSAIMAFRNAIQLSAGLSFDGRTSLSGRFQNNLACVNVEMGNYKFALSEFEQSLRWQKNSSSSKDADTSDADNLLSISLTILNIGVTCARQKHYHAAFKHTEASHAMQEALLGPNNELTLNTLFYLDLIKKVIATSDGPETKAHKNRPQNHTLGSPQRINRTQTDQVLDILDFNPASPGRRVNSDNNTATKHGLSLFSKSNEISHPMLSLGSLKVEATAVEQVRDCLFRYDTNLSKGKDRMKHVSIMRSLLCKKPIQGTKQSSISSKLVNFGLKTLRKREMQAELHENLERYGPRHPLVGQAHHSLALVLLCIENFEESISHFDKSIRINTQALGVKHPDVSSSLMFMALAQFALERFDDALASMLRVRHIRESQLGKKHPEIYEILNNLACVHFERGDLKQAESMLQESLDLQREIFRTEPEFLRGVSTVLCNIAFVHAKNGAFPKALIELEGALQIRQDILLEDSSTGDITENMAYILAIHQLQHGSGNIDDITNEYITMLRKS